MSGNYYDANSIAANTRVNIPQFDTGGMLKAGQVLGESLNYFRDKELADYKTTEDKRRFELQSARADSQEKRAIGEEKRAIDAYERNIREKSATNDALRAVIDPNGYKASKMADEQKAVEESYKLMSPEEVAAVKAQYDPSVSGKGWVDTASSAQGVDVGRVLDTKSKQYEIAAKTPGTPEYVAAENAKMDLFKREQAISHGNRMAEIGAQTGAQLKYLEATQNAPQKMVNPTTGEAKYVRPSEIDKFPGYMDASTYSATLTDKRDREEKEKEFRRKISETTNKAKGDLAETLQSYDDESRNAVITSTSDANSVIQEFNKGSGKNIQGLSNADINALVKRSKGMNLPFTRSDLNTDLFRQSLASEISQKTGKPYEEILNRLEGIEPSKQVTPSVVKPNSRLILDPNYGFSD